MILTCITVLILKMQCLKRKMCFLLSLKNGGGHVLCIYISILCNSFIKTLWTHNISR